MTDIEDGFLSGASEEEPDNGEESFLSDFDDSGGLIEDIEDGFLSGDTESSEVDTSKVSYRPEIHFSSSENMTEVSDESVHLIVTSPPYNTDWSYGSHDDDLDYATEYMPMLARIFKECYRVLVPGGRMVVNVPSLLRDGNNGGFAISSDIAVMLNDRTQPFLLRYEDDQKDIAELKAQTDWKMRELIIWNKGFNTDGLAPNGSFPRPWGILMNNMHEVALVVQKPGDRSYDEMSDQRIEDSKIKNKWTDELCDDVWDISPDSWSFDYVDGEDVPPFPEEFVRRCIAIWSYKDDTVLDPFAGRFTVGKVAKEMERESIGYELRDELKKDIEEYTGMNNSGLDNWT